MSARKTSRRQAPAVDVDSNRIDRFIVAAQNFADAARSPATRRAYESDTRLFRDWCTNRELLSRPALPQTVALYTAELFEQKLAVAAIRRRIIAIGVYHLEHDLNSPVAHEIVRNGLKGIRRTLGVAQAKKEPLCAGDLKEMLAALPNDVRDRAVLLLGYSGVFRRSELASIKVEHVARVRGGVEITLLTSKTDQDRAGVRVVIEIGKNKATCPVASLQRYLNRANITAGPVFRAIDRHGNLSAKALTGESVALILQKHVEARLPQDPSRYSAHLLRAAFTSMLEEGGASITKIMRRGRWKSDRVVRGYIRSDD